MSFNEMNTIENALRDHLVGRPVTASTCSIGINELKFNEGYEYED